MKPTHPLSEELRDMAAVLHETGPYPYKSTLADDCARAANELDSLADALRTSQARVERLEAENKALRADLLREWRDQR